jgi:2-aminomuconate deaminase
MTMKKMKKKSRTASGKGTGYLSGKKTLAAKTKKSAKNSAQAEFLEAGAARNSVRTESGHFSKRAPVPVGPYPHARRVGDFIFVSGMGPRTASGQYIPGVNIDAMGRVQSHDIAAQTHSVIQNIKNVLEDMGSGLEDVVDVTVFLTHMKQDFKTFNKVYGEYFAKIGPTRTTVEVLSLPTPINVELKVIAHCP